MTRLETGIWDKTLAYLRANHSGIVRIWFDDITADDFDHGNLRIRSADAGQLSYLRRYCGRAFREAAQAVTGRLITVDFVGQNGETFDDDAGSEAATIRRDRLVRLNGDYTFENLVVGPSNRLAHAACVAASESPGAAYNPLFIHGTVGLGKTHMLQAICHTILDKTPGAEVVYLTCETFVNEFIEAVEKGHLQDFRHQYRHADVLIIDDIQFLARRERTQEEFFHTFNTLYQYNKQIVLSADCSPSDIDDLEDRLVSRFNWGLVARVDPPCEETRNAILRKKAKLRGLNLPNEVTAYIAKHVAANIRELEGALNRLHGLSALEKVEPNLGLAKAALGQAMSAAAPEVQISDIASHVGARYGVRVTELQGKRRSRSIAFPRQAAMFLARKLTRHSLEEIGAYFGGRDHTTVLHAIRLIGRKRGEDSELNTRLTEMEDALTRRSTPKTAS